MSQSGKPLDSFPQFSKFPLEIQRMIWGYAVDGIKSRIIVCTIASSIPDVNSVRWKGLKPIQTYHSCTEVAPWASSPVQGFLYDEDGPNNPATLGVNRESRKATLKRYSLSQFRLRSQGHRLISVAFDAATDSVMLKGDSNVVMSTGRFYNLRNSEMWKPQTKNLFLDAHSLLATRKNESQSDCLERIYAQTHRLLSLFDNLQSLAVIFKVQNKKGEVTALGDYLIDKELQDIRPSLRLLAVRDAIQMRADYLPEFVPLSFQLIFSYGDSEEED